MTRKILAQKEELLKLDVESSELARDVSVSLNKLADFLALRGQAGDAEQALGHYARSLEVRERLLVANPESAQAARDVMVSLERMAQFFGSHKEADAAQQALDYQLWALEIAVRLHESNRQSVYYGRAAAVWFCLAAQRAMAAGQQELGGKCLAACHATLHELTTAGCVLDAAMAGLYEQLRTMFGEAG